MCSLSEWIRSRPMPLELLLLFVLVAGACSARPVWSLEIEVSDGVAPLAGAQVLVEGRAVGRTDARGIVTVREARGQPRVRVGVRCPSGFVDPEVRVVATDVAERAPLLLRYGCAPQLIIWPLVVHAPLCAGCVVRVDGEQMGRISEQGVARLAVRRPPLSRVHVMIDTSEAPRLAPQHPLHELTLPARDSVVLVAQVFAQTPSPSRRTRAQPKPAIHRPYAIRIRD